MTRRLHFATQLLHWAARITAVTLVAMLLLFLIGEGGPNPFHQSWRSNLQHLAFLVLTPVGLLVGWRRPLAGGLLALAGMLAFYGLNFSASGQVPGGAFPLFFVPPTLYLLDACLTLTRPRRA